MFKRLLSLTLAILLVFSFMPVQAMATETSPAEGPTIPSTEEPTIPPTGAPTVPPTEEPTVPTTEEPTVPPTEEPTVPPTEELTVPPTEEPTVPPTEEPTVPPTEEPTVPPTEEATVPATEPIKEPVKGSPSKRQLLYSPGPPKKNIEPVTSDVEFSMYLYGIDSETVSKVYLELSHEDGVTTRTVEIINEYDYGYDVYSLPVGKYSVRVSGLSLEGYEVRLNAPSTLEVIENETTWYDFSITAYKPNCSASVNVSFAAGSALQANDFPNGITLTVGNDLTGRSTYTLDSSHGWAASVSGLPSGFGVGFNLGLSGTTGYQLSVSYNSNGSNYSHHYGPVYSVHSPTSIETQIGFEDGGNYAMNLVLDFQKFDSGDVELSMEVTSDEALPEGKPEPAIVTIYDESWETRYEGTFTDNKLTVTSLPVGEYYLDLYWDDVAGFTSDTTYPSSFTVTKDSTTKLDLAVHYSAIKYGSVVVNFVVEADQPIPENQLLQKNISIWGDIDSFNESSDGDSITFENVAVGLYSLNVDEFDLKGYKVTVEKPEEFTVAEDETTELTVTFKCTAIKCGSAKLQFKATGDPLPEGQPAYIRGMFHDGYLDGGMNVNRYPVELTAENNWTATVDYLPEGDYFFSLFEYHVDGFLITNTERSSEFVTVKEGTVAEAVYTAEYADASRFGNVEVIANLADPNMYPEDGYVVLTDSNGEEYTDWFWFDEGESYNTLENLPAGEYTVRVCDCDISGYKAIVTAPSTITVEGGTDVTLSISISYKKLGKGSLQCGLRFNLGNYQDLPDAYINTILDSLNVVAIDTSGKEYTLDIYGADPDNGHWDPYSTIEDLPEGFYTIRVSGYELDGYKVSGYEDIYVNISADTNTWASYTLLYYETESTFRATVQFAEGSALNERNFTEGLEFWFYNPSIIGTHTGKLDAANGWTVAFDDLPCYGELSFELKSPALDDYVLYDVQVSVDQENCTQWYKRHTSQLPFELKHRIEFESPGSYEIVITLDIREAPNDPPEGSVALDLEIFEHSPLGDQFPESITVVLTGHDGKEYTAEASAANNWRVVFEQLPFGWYMPNVRNHEIEGFACYTCSDMLYEFPINLSISADSPAEDRGLELHYYRPDGTAKVNIQFADESVFHADTYPAKMEVQLTTYPFIEKSILLDSESGWSATFDNVPNDIVSWLTISPNLPAGYSVRQCSYTESGSNYGDDPLFVPESGPGSFTDTYYSIGKDLTFTNNGSYELTVILDIVKDEWTSYDGDGTFTIKKTFSAESILQEEDFPDGIPVTVRHQDENDDFGMFETLVLGPENNWMHTFTDMPYGTYWVEFDDFVSEYITNGGFQRKEDGTYFNLIEISDDTHETYIFESLYYDNRGDVQVNVRFTPGSALDQSSFPETIRLLFGGEVYELNRGNSFTQTKTFAGTRNNFGLSYYFEQAEIPNVEGYTLTLEQYTHPRYLKVVTGETTTLDIILKYEPTTDGTLTVSERFYKESDARAIDLSVIYVYLTDLDGNVLQRGLLNRDNQWNYVFDLPDEEGDYIVRQEYWDSGSYCVYSDTNEQRVHLVPGESSHVSFMSDCRTLIGATVTTNFTDDSALDWYDLPKGFILEVTDSTGRFTFRTPVLNSFSIWDGRLGLCTGIYDKYRLINADVDGYNRVTTLGYSYRIGGASLRPQEPVEEFVGGTDSFSIYDINGIYLSVITLTNHYTRMGTLTITNDETFAKLDGSKLPGSLNSGYESNCYTYKAVVDGEEETFTLEPGEEKVIKYIPNGAEYSVSIIAENGIAWNTPVMVTNGKIQGVDNKDETFDHKVQKHHEYLYLLDDDGVSARFVKTNTSASPLSNAKFGIYSDAACTQLVEYVTSGTDGKVILHFDEAGTWYIKEVNAPAGYQLSSKVITASVTQKWTTENRSDDNGNTIIVIKETLEATLSGLTVIDGVPRFENSAIVVDDEDDDADDKKDDNNDKDDVDDKKDNASAKPGNSNIPATGDSANPALWAFLLIMSAIGLVLLILKRRKNTV